VNTQSKTVAIDDCAVEVKECVTKRAHPFPVTLLSACEVCRSTCEYSHWGFWFSWL